MEILKGFNQLIYFLVELMMFSSLGYVGFQINPQSFAKYLTGFGFPILAIILWGIFAAPNSSYRLESPYRAIFAIALFEISALLLYRTGQVKIAIIFGLIAFVSQLLALALKQ